MIYERVASRDQTFTTRTPPSHFRTDRTRRRQGSRANWCPCTTSGDTRLDVPLSALGGQGVFAVEIQRAVRRGDADVAVHSAKDLPSTSPDGLMLTCVPQRLDPSDVLVGRSLAGSGSGRDGRDGVASASRAPTRAPTRSSHHRVARQHGVTPSAAGTGGVDAVVAAAAALERLGESDRVAERLDTSWFVPQVGQGAIALEARMDDLDTLLTLAAMNDVDAFTCVDAERAYLRELGVGCSIPAGAYAVIRNGVLSIDGVMIGVDGTKSVRATLEGSNPQSLGTRLAQLLRDDMGGGALPGWDGVS